MVGGVGSARRARVFAAVLAFVLGHGCHATPAVPPNVLLIVVDTLRADRLGAYGSTRGLTPFLDSLAGRGFVFHNAFAACSWTNPSLASLITSRHPWQHAMTSLRSVLPPHEITLAEVLREQGYITAGWSANPLQAVSRGWGQGFDHYMNPLPSKTKGVVAALPERGNVLNDRVRSWLHWLGRSRPAYIFLQYMEPHPPYAPPADVLEQLFRDRPKPDVNAINNLTWVASWIKKGDLLRPQIEKLYDAQVLALDKAVAGLFGDLDQGGFLENTVIMITADHGEGLWDHGTFGHGGSLYDELIRVPLIVLVPSHGGRVDIDEIVSLVDIAPTLIDFAGAPQPPSFEGHSFRYLLEQDSSWSLRGWARRAWTSPARIAYSDMGMTQEAAAQLESSRHRRAVIMGPYKLIAGPDGYSELYDRTRDPHEQGTAEIPESIQQQLRASLAAGAPPPDQLVIGEVKDLDAGQKEWLRALGYSE